MLRKDGKLDDQIWTYNSFEKWKKENLCDEKEFINKLTKWFNN